MRRVRDAWPQVVSPLLAAALGIVINLLTDRFAWALFAGFLVLLGMQIMIEVRVARKDRGESTEASGPGWSVPARLRAPHLWVVGSGALAAVTVIAVVGWVQAAVNDENQSATDESLTVTWGDPTPRCPIPANGNYAIAVGARSNSPRPTIPAEMFTSMDAKAEKVSIVRIDGSPVVTARLQSDPSRPDTAAQRAMVVSRFLQQAREAVAAARANSPEAAPLAALSLAAREVGPGGAVVIVDSGLQTVDPIDFRRGFLTASPVEVSQWLKDNQLLPNLKGRTVLMAGLGDTSSPQPALDDALRGGLVAIWQQIAKDAGASCVSTVTAPAPGAPLEGLPPVSVVSLPPTPSLRLSCRPSSFTTASTIGFDGDSTKFRDPEAATGTLRKLAEDISVGNLRVTVTGTAGGHGSREVQLSLSMARARAVRAELLRYGVPGNLVTVKAVGSDFPGFVDDVDARGNLDPVLAAKNRSVILQLAC